MRGKLYGDMSQSLIKFILEVLVTVSFEICQNDLDNVIPILIVAQVDEFTIFKGKYFLIEDWEFFAFSTEAKPILYESCDYLVDAALIDMCINDTQRQIIRYITHLLFSHVNPALLVNHLAEINLLEFFEVVQLLSVVF